MLDCLLDYSVHSGDFRVFQAKRKTHERYK
nr:MAG TPA: hypothetical protein [Caudoviricetes sp.]